MQNSTLAESGHHARRGSEFAELSRQVKQAGLLRRRYGYYATKIATNVVLLAAAVALFMIIGESWWQLLTAVLFAVIFTQFAYIGHDAAHRQIFASRRANDLVGYAHAAVTGISYRWWVGKHNRHHANPNHEDDDPDLNIPALAFTTDQALAKRGLRRVVARHQAFLFFPLLQFEAIMLRKSSLRAVLRREVSHPWLEGALLATHILGYLALVFLVLSPVKAVLFIAVHQAVMGIYLGCSFAPNHKGMPVLTGDEQPDFLRKQVLTSRNVVGGRWVEVLLGGLNYQIEHHLFPSMPRPNLRHAQTLVHDFCARRGVRYSRCSLLRSYADVLRDLHRVGAPLRQPAPLAPPAAS